MGNKYIKNDKKTYDDLTDMQKAWLDEYLITRNAKQAAINAGYKASRANSTGYELLHKLKHLIQPRVEEINNGRIMSAQDILAKLSDIANGIEKDAFGLDVSNQDKLKALELLGKTYQMYTDKVKTDLDMDININLVDDNNVIELNGNTGKEINSEDHKMLGGGN